MHYLKSINSMSADQLASTFLKEYFDNSAITFPINPFQMLADLGIPFMLRPFKNYDGIFISAEDEDDIPVVAININRPIARQRYSAAHELCHYLKDSNKQFACTPSSNNSIEKYAEKFASELLMPINELKNQTLKYAIDGYVDFESVLKIADYLGFRVCIKLHTGYI